MDYKPCTVVAEACCNHQGNLDIAKEMIKISKLCGADYVKFQKRNPEKAVPINMHKKPHPCPINSFGETYLEHRKKLEFTLDQHIELKQYCDNVGIGYSCSVWDEDSARDIISLNSDFIKVPSPMNENYFLLDILFKEYDKDIHISLGMIENEAKRDLFNYLIERKDRVIMYHTTSGYPVKFEELYLKEISKFSGHHLGIAADIAAYSLGATWIERHFTLDRTAKGTDQAASLEPSGLQKMVRDLKAIYKSFSYKSRLTEDEMKNAEKLKIKIPMRRQG